MLKNLYLIPRIYNTSLIKECSPFFLFIDTSPIPYVESVMSSVNFTLFFNALLILTNQSFFMSYALNTHSQGTIGRCILCLLVQSPSRFQAIVPCFGCIFLHYFLLQQSSLIMFSHHLLSLKTLLQLLVDHSCCHDIREKNVKAFGRYKIRHCSCHLCSTSFSSVATFVIA